MQICVEIARTEHAGLICLYDRCGFHFNTCYVITGRSDILNGRADGFFKGRGFAMEINGKHSITGAWRAVVAARGKQGVGKVLRQFEGGGKNQPKVIFVHSSIPVQMGRPVVLMRTTINGTPNVLGMIL
jgi:hypothetical protein